MQAHLSSKQKECARGVMGLDDNLTSMIHCNNTVD